MRALKMKHILVSIVLSFIFHTTQAQYFLDAKNGFNKFTLGSALKDVKNIASISKSRSNERNKYLQRYDVKRMNEYNLFGYGLSRIQLIFYKDRLHTIQVYLDISDYGRERYNIIFPDIFEKIQVKYGLFEQRELNARDKLNNRNSLYSIIGSKVTLFASTNNAYSVFSFTSNEVSKQEGEEEQTDYNGL